MTRKVGDMVWRARHRWSEVHETCCVCYGTKKVKLILGNDDIVELPCEHCSIGYGGPTGYIVTHDWVSTVDCAMITEVRTTETCTGVEAEYIFYDHELHRDDTVFDNEKDAEAKAEDLSTQRRAEEAKRFERSLAEGKRKISNVAGYHIREANKLRKKAEWHAEQARVLKAR